MLSVSNDFQGVGVELPQKKIRMCGILRINRSAFPLPEYWQRSLGVRAHEHYWQNLQPEAPTVGGAN